jgi:hypothetical protein
MNIPLAFIVVRAVFFFGVLRHLNQEDFGIDET